VNAAMSSSARPVDLSDPVSLPPLQPPRRGLRRLFLHPLTSICAVQAILSLTLVWSNTAFGDEADYLWIGHLEWAHWLHDASWPSAYAHGSLSGSPLVYPPLGALADSVSGLAGARILSLSFMLTATILLYLTASRLVGRTAALAAAALWAFSEPVIRLAFATFDPLSVLLTAVAAWLTVQVCHRRSGALLVIAAAAALALANVTAYSGIVIDPVVIAFAFMVWAPFMRASLALIRVLFFLGALGALFGLVMTASQSWPGLKFTIISRALSDHQSLYLVGYDIWAYSGLITSLAVVGMVIAVGAEGGRRAALLALLGCAAFVVPAAQLHEQTGWSLDKHLAYGLWFATMAAGYACMKLLRWLPRANPTIVATCCAIALTYPAVNSWQSAWRVYHSWRNAHSFINAFGPVVKRSPGYIFAGGQSLIAEYYTPEGRDWTRWTSTLPLDPRIRPRSSWEAFYATQLKSGRYGAIALFYSTTFSSAPEMPPRLLLPNSGSGSTNQGLLSLVGEGSGEPGLPALTQALESDQQYRLVAEGHYDSIRDHGIYAIWEKKTQT
jgi:hypothetical protein